VRGMWHAWERRKSVRGLVGKPEGKTSLRGPKRRWEDGIMDLGEIGWGRCGVDLVGSG
jgi:hypothetical protein